MKRYPANMADFMDMFPTEDACLEYLSIVRWPDGYKCLRLLEEGSWPFHLPRMRVRGFSAGRHVVSGHPQTAPLMVSGDVVCGEPEKRRQRAGAAKGAGPGQLSHRMGMVAQAAPRYGSSRPQQAIRHSRSGRDFPWRQAPGSRAWSRRQVLDFHCGGRSERQRECNWPHSPFRAGNAAGETLAKAVQAAVEPGSLVRSDGLAGYSFLPDYGYIHVPSFHKEATPGDATPLAHRVASLLKRWWLGTHQGAIRPDHLACSTGEPHARAASCFTGLSKARCKPIRSQPRR